MTAPQLTRLDEHLQRLRLFKVRERLDALLQEATTHELSYVDFLEQLLTEEVTAKPAKHVTMRTNMARFPFVKGLDRFDFGYQPSLDKKQIQALSPCHFREHRENVVLLGPPGVGKTSTGSCITPSRSTSAGTRIDSRRNSKPASSNRPRPSRRPRPVNAAAAVDGKRTAHRRLELRCAGSHKRPRALVVTLRGWGIFDDHTWRNLNDP